MAVDVMVGAFIKWAVQPAVDRCVRFIKQRNENAYLRMAPEERRRYVTLSQERWVQQQDFRERGHKLTLRYRLSFRLGRWARLLVSVGRERRKRAP
jgi:hypothetical protein